MLSETEKSILDLIDDSQVIEWTRELTRIKSVVGVDPALENEEQAALWVAERLREMGCRVEVYEVSPGRPNVIGIYDTGRPGPTLMFEGHTDVVTAGDLSQWTVDPFGAEIRDGKIYGRGANDMKGGLVASLLGVQALIKSGLLTRGRIKFGICIDEEGMMTGVKDLVKKGWADDVDACVVCEPEENNICFCQKGGIRIEITTLGIMAHGAMPLTGINPTTRMARVILKLEDLEAREKETYGRDPYVGWPSITPTVIQSPPVDLGEPQLNVMPDRCRLYLDIRTVPGQDHQVLIEKIGGILNGLKEDDPHFRAEMRIIDDRPATFTPRDADIIRVTDACLRDLTGREPVYNGVPGATDGTFINAWKNIPIVTVGPGNREIPHHVDEFLEIDQLLVAVRLYALLAFRFLNRTGY
ncbi:MAG: M20 family metallopeptidase [Desulfocucumaceae bacterium]